MVFLRPAVRTAVALLLTAPFLRAQNPAPKPAPPNSFAEVTAQLDTGGNFLLYLSAEAWLKGLSAQLAAVRDAPGQGPAENREAYLRYFTLIVDGLRASGLEDLTGIGMSSFPAAPGVTRQKFFLHHAAGRGEGFLWTLLGPAPHPLEGLPLLPAGTALAAFSDLDPIQLSTLLRQATEHLGEPVIQGMYQQGMMQLSAVTGLPAEEALRALTGAAGVILTLDESQKVPFEISGETVTVPRPALAVLLPAKDDRIYQQLAKMVEANPGTVRTDEGDLHLRVATEMPLTPDFKLHPAVARWKDWLIVASDESLIRQIIAASASGKGFAATPAFAKLSAGLPVQGNGFQLTTELLASTVATVQSASLKSAGAALPAASQAAMMQKLLAAQGQQSGFAITSHLPNGWLSVGNTFSTAEPSAFGTMLGSLIDQGLRMQFGGASPGGDDEATTEQSLAHLRQLSLACHQYAQEHNGAFPPALKDLVPKYVTDVAVLKSPFAPDKEDGYQYTKNLTEKSAAATVLLQDAYAPKADKKVLIRVDGTEVTE